MSKGAFSKASLMAAVAAGLGAISVDSPIDRGGASVSYPYYKLSSGERHRERSKRNDLAKRRAKNKAARKSRKAG